MLKLLLRNLIFILSIILISACTNTSNTDVQKKKMEEISLKQNELGKKYNAMMDWEDTFKDQLSVKIQGAMKNKTVLFKDYYLEDVYEQGASLTAKLYGYDGFYLILKINANSDMVNKIISDDLKYKNLSVVVDIKDITIPQIALNPQKVDSENMEIEISTRTTRQVNGRLIDFIVQE